MPRYSLRNKHKIQAHYSKEILDRILCSLNEHFGNGYNIEQQGHTPYNLITIIDIGNTCGFIVFYVIKKTFDVYNLAFKEFIS